MLKSAVLGVLNPQKKLFVTALGSGATFPVLQLLDYVPNENGVYVPREDVSGATRTAPYVSSYNGFMIPNFTTIRDNGNAEATYPNSIDAETGNVLEPTVLVGSNMPFLNTSLQPVYTLELDTLEPDTGAIGGKIVL